MTIDRLLASLHSTNPVNGLTHTFYRYPARMSPELAREAILLFSHKGEIILDPFMGGGTSIVEAVAAGRQGIGIDLNSLAVFVAAAKTTPLSPYDQEKIRRWAGELDFSTADKPLATFEGIEPRTKQLPEKIQQVFTHALQRADSLSLPRQRSFARCVLLRLGQWAIDCKTVLPEANRLKEKLDTFVNEMLAGLNEYVATAQKHGIAKNKLTRQRKLLLRSSVDVHLDPRLVETIGKPKLIITSPPYPGVHVLYHRWQISGRRQTPAPYWFIDAQDGHTESYYTLGSRSKLGHENYFWGLAAVYRSVREIIHKVCRDICQRGNDLQSKIKNHLIDHQRFLTVVI
jgi:hypothetical protein